MTICSLLKSPGYRLHEMIVETVTEIESGIGAASVAGRDRLAIEAQGLHDAKPR